MHLGDFSSLLELGFGINLALSVLREYVVTGHGKLVKRLDALQALANNRKYEGDLKIGDVMAHIGKVRSMIILWEDNLNKYVEAGALAGFLFALHCLYRLLASAYDETCYGAWEVALSVGVNFIPVPAALLLLSFIGRSQKNAIQSELDCLQQKCMSG